MNRTTAADQLQLHFAGNIKDCLGSGGDDEWDYNEDKVSQVKIANLSRISLA